MSKKTPTVTMPLWESVTTGLKILLRKQRRPTRLSAYSLSLDIVIAAWRLLLRLADVVIASVLAALSTDPETYLVRNKQQIDNLFSKKELSVIGTHLMRGE